MVKKNRKRKSEESSPITKKKLQKTFRTRNGRNQSRVDEGDESDSLFMTESPHIQETSLSWEETYKPKPNQKFRTKHKHDDFENNTESQLSFFSVFFLKFNYIILPNVFGYKDSQIKDSTRFEYYILFKDTNELSLSLRFFLNRSFLAMIAKQSDYNKRAAKVTKEFLQKFTQDIGDHTSNLKNHVQNLNLISIKKDNDFLISFKAAFTFSHPSSSHHDSTSNQNFDFSSLLPHYQDLISKAHRAVELFESVDQEIAAMKAKNSLINFKWDQEVIEAENLLKLGRQVGIERYNAMIQGDKMMKINVDNKIFSPSSSSSSKISKQDLVDQLLYQSDNILSNCDTTWGTVAQKQLRALKKLAKVSKKS
ncbi:hypothetical protein GcC1_033002 [Golovinomyces cichoracearum]|uniref:Uncharacterized protein n=1 Tax=Golovinomyces cichoracearum TaxID=62708 RepID=A0A420J1N2_9PEZI|nr:hypothetical protein GcC1_033002 [Golovinomyces cichoracearum]